MITDAAEDPLADVKEDSETFVGVEEGGGVEVEEEEGGNRFTQEQEFSCKLLILDLFYTQEEFFERASVKYKMKLCTCCEL